MVVVGAGPSGSALAAMLAQQGHDVLLLDRQKFPRDKTCGDAIPAAAIDLLYSIGLKERLQEANFYPIHKVLLSSPRGHAMVSDLQPSTMGTESIVAPRIQFDQIVHDFAVTSGAEARKGLVQAPLVSDGRVEGVVVKNGSSTSTIKSRLVVGADGSTSVVGRHLRPDDNHPRHRAVALRAYVSGIELKPGTVEFYMYRGILPGYAWIFPISETEANVGLGMRLDRFQKSDLSLKDLLDRFFRIPEIAARLNGDYAAREVATWQLNFGSQKNVQRAFDGAMLIGDAASLINPLTGGGIHNSLLSAQLAARTAHEALIKGDTSLTTLTQYQNACLEQLWPGLKRSYFLQRALLYFPGWVDLLVKLGRSNSGFAQTFMTKL